MSTFNHDEEQFPYPTGKWKALTTNDAYDQVQQLSKDSWKDIHEAERLWQLENDSANSEESDEYFDSSDLEKKRLKFLQDNGFESIAHFDAYESFISSTLDHAAYAQAKMEAMVSAQQKSVSDNAIAMADTIMAPISGVSLEMYAQINAQLAQGKDQREVLKQNGIESVSWDKAVEGWNERMRTDMSFTVTSEYSRFFMAAGQGQFGSVANEVADGMTGKKSTSDNPLTLEKYAEIMAAQGAAAAQGKDASQVLANYGLNAADWGTLGLHWNNKMMTDMQVGMKFGELYSKYTEQFAVETPKVADDINF